MSLRNAVPGAVALVLGALAVASGAARADETCQSPFLAKITGQEDYVYVWTLGVKGWGDESDKLVTIGTNPARPDFGQVVSAVAVGGQHEAHHGGFNDDRTRLWLGGLDSSTIFIFDVATDPANPKLVKKIETFVEDSGGVVGPHTFYALPGRMLISGLSNAHDRGGRTGLVEYSNEGKYIRTTWMPQSAPYGYDSRVNANLNRMLTTSFTGKNNYMAALPKLMKDPVAMENFGNTMVVWDYHAMKPLQVLEVPGAPLEVRWALQPRHHYAFTTAALTGRLWGIFRKDDGSYEALDLAPIGDPNSPTLPVDISLSSDDRYLFVDTFMDGTTRVFDVSNPRAPKQIYERKLGSQLNMVSQSWDGKRVYYTSSLLANWDQTGPANEQFLKAYTWDGVKLTPSFEVDFRALELGRPHIMRFGDVELHQPQGLPEAAPAAATP
jgi:selenium-binding protein 1